MLRAEKLKTVSSVKIKEYGSNSKRIMLRPCQKGSILIGLIITMVIMASLGAGMVYLTTTSTFQELFANNHARAYYSAESGGRYALSVIRDAYATDLTKLNAINANQTFTIANNGGQFQITNLVQNGANPETVTFTSTGTVNSGFLQAKRQINYSVQPANQSAAGGGTTTTPIAADQLVNPSSMLPYFGGMQGATNDGASAITANPVGQDTGDEQRATVGYSGPSLWSSWTAAGGLSYEAQVKVKSNTPYFLAGLAFRMNGGTTTVLNSFYVSFMRSSDNGDYSELWQGNDDKIPGELSNFVTENDYYIVLWKDDPYTFNPTEQGERIIAFKKLPANSGVFTETVHFTDDMESGTLKWTTVDSPWAQITSDSHSASHSWTDSPGGNYANNIDKRLTSQVINLPTGSNPILTFWHHYDIEPRAGDGTWYDWGAVEISTNGGGSWTRLQRSAGNQPSWSLETIDLSDYAGQSNVRIRFRLITDGSVTRDGWYIDDVKITSSSLTAWSTLLVRIQEKVKTSNDYSPSRIALNSRVNEIMVYYGTPTSNPTGNTTTDHTYPYDNNRIGSNPRDIVDPFDTANWPAGTNGVVNDSVAAVSDPNFTLVQWDWVRPQTPPSGTWSWPDWHCTVFGYHGTCSSAYNDDNYFEANSNNTIVRTTYNLTPSSGTWPVGRQEVGLVAFGNYITNNLWLDDFAVRTGGGGANIDGSGTVVQY